ncbi:MAG: thioredoxin family protein, partial [Fervidobacterium sp.]
HKVSEIEDKILVIMFSSPSCYYCKLFDKDVLANKDVQEFLRGNYVFVRIEPSNYKTTFLGKSYSNNDLFTAFGVRGTPAFFFLKAKELITQVPGYMPVEDFLKALKYLIRVVEENYNESFDAYAKKKDNLLGKPKVVNVTKDKADYILKYDSNSIIVSETPKNIDIYTVYITSNEQLAKKLNEAGVIRVLLIK